MILNCFICLFRFIVNKSTAAARRQFVPCASYSKSNDNIVCGLLLLQDFCCLRSKAVDVPVSLAVPVADGDGEPAKVCPDDLDGAVEAGAVRRLARHGHVLALASVVGLVQSTVRSSTCKKNHFVRQILLFLLKKERHEIMREMTSGKERLN